MATIESIVVNEANNTVDVVFGYDMDTVYSYYGIDAETAKAWQNADSKGKFFHSAIRGNFEFTKDAVK